MILYAGTYISLQRKATLEKGSIPKYSDGKVPMVQPGRFNDNLELKVAPFSAFSTIF